MNEPFSLVPQEQTYVAHYDIPDQGIITPGGYSATSLRIRPTQLEDLPSIAALLAESFYPSGSLMGWLSLLFQMGIHQELRSRMLSASPNHVCLVAVQDVPGKSTNGHVAGTVEVGLPTQLPWQFSTSKHPYISNLAVKPTYRRQGVAQHLLFACEQTVLEWGFQDLYLHVLENNQPAQQLYTKVGYQRQSTHSFWPQSLFGQPRRLLLHKHL